MRLKHIAASVCLAAVSTIAWISIGQSATEATVITSKKRYSVGETMGISGTGFIPGHSITVSVVRPDKLTEYVLPAPTADASGSFSASYTPPQLPGRYRITATDGVNTAITATTEADAIGFNKGVFNKSTPAADGPAGEWTTGNAGSNYRENQWVFYQYQVTGITSAASVPSFDVTFNHFQSNSNAIFIDGFANFRACVDCTDQTNTSGPSEGMLSDGVSHPSFASTAWVNAASALSNINGPLVNGACAAPGTEAVNTPAADHCFHVNGSLLAGLFPAPTFTSGTHTITLFYEAHLSKTTTWTTGKEHLLGCAGSEFYAAPRADVVPTGVTYGTNAYSGGVPCNIPPPVNGDWTGSFNGVGSATGSSRHFSIDNQTDGPSGGLTLPIPTVPAPTGSITIVKVTDPAAATGAVFNFTGFTAFSLDTDASTGAILDSRTFSGLTGGDIFTFTESLLAGWDLTNLQCVNNTGASILNTDLGTRTATVTLADTGGASVTCTFTNTQKARLRIAKATNPDGDTTDFTFTPTNWNSGASFTRRDNQPALDSGFLTPGATNYDTVESVPSGWALTDRACVLTGTLTAKAFTNITDGIRVNLNAGEDVTCTFTDTKQAQLRIAKVTNPDGDTTDFTFTPANWNGNATFTRRDNDTAFASGFIAPGATNYDAVETVPSEWALTDRVCVLTGTATAKAFNTISNGIRVNLAAGEDVTCTFTNTKQAQLRIEKVTNPNGDTTLFTFTPANWNGGSTFQRKDNDPAFASGFLTPGATNYDAVETVPSGWALTDRACVLTGTATVKTFTSISDGIRVTLAAGEDVTCTFTNTKQAQLHIVKSTNPDGDTTDFTFTPANWNGNATFTRRDNQAAFDSGFLTPGATNYDAVETVLAGWALTDRACVLTGTATVKTFTNITDGIRVTLAAGEDVTCTFTNTKQARLRVAKSTNPDGDTTDFTFTPANWNGNATFTRRDNEAAFASAFLTPGATNYDAVETIPSGWVLTDRVCVLTGTATAKAFASITDGVRVTLAAGEDVTCTFTDTKQAQLRIEKVTNPNGDTTDFTFTPANWNGNATFTRRDNEAAFASGSLAPGATNYDAVETIPSGWALTDRVCVLTGTATAKAFTAISNGVRVTLAAGEDVTCTFTDTKQAQLRIVKATNPDGDTTDFTFTPANWNGNATFTRRDNEAAFPSGFLTPGATNYEAVETIPSGWALTDRVCVLTGTATAKAFTPLNGTGIRVNLAAGEDVTCTFTNTKQAVLRIAKVTNPDGDTTDFTFTPANWNGNATFTRRDNEAAFASGNLTPGATNYDAVETILSGWALTDRVCVLTGTATAKAFTPLNGTGVRVNLAAGEDVTCTFTNTRQARLRIAKATDPNGDTTLFTFTPANWNGGSTFQRKDNDPAFASGFLTPGATNYEAVETVPSGWVLTDRVCVLTGTATAKAFTPLNGTGVRVNLAVGEDVTCTFTNTKQAQLRIVKATVPNGDTTFFTFTPTNWNSNNNFMRQDNQAAFASGFLTPGATNYDTVETVPSGWALTNRVCVLTNTATLKTFATIGATGVRVNLAVGEDVTCTFTNSRLPTLQVRKQIQGASQQFSFTSSTVLANFSLTPPSNGSAQTAVTIIDVGAGQTISEVNIPAGWVLTDSTCVGAAAFSPDVNGNGGTFTADYGNTILCTFIDSQQGGATRTQGFWATHTVLANTVWNGGTLPPPNDGVIFSPVVGSGNDTFACMSQPISAIAATGQNQLMGGFWSGISQTSDKKKRSALDQARMQFLQQYLAAALNSALFGTPIPGITLAQARTVYCTGTAKQIVDAKSLLAAYNESGDSVVFTPGASATPKDSKDQANIPYWDDTTPAL